MSSNYLIPPSFAPKPWQPPFPKCHLLEVTRYVTFADWLLSLSNINLRFPQGFQGVVVLFITEYYSIIWMYHTLLVRSPFERISWRFQILSIMNTAAVNIHPQVSLCTQNFNSFGPMPRIAIAGLYVKNTFSFVRNGQTIFQSGCTILHFQRQQIKVPIPLHCCQPLTFSVF